MTEDKIFTALAAFDGALSGMKSGDDAWQALRVLAETLVGAKLFTVSVVDWANERAAKRRDGDSSGISESMPS